MYRIFVVEDDDVIAGAIKKHISSWGCEVRCAENFADVLAEFTAFDPQLVLMDVKLPFYNGYYWCSAIRRVSKIPIVFISSASDSMDIIMAMNMGGDDFIVKPFDLSVLTAKVQALLRRTYDFSVGTGLIEHRGAVLNVNDATLSFNGEKLRLSRNDFIIMRTLMESKGRTVSRDTLMMKLWETDSFVDENTLTVNITRLRKKLDAAGIPDFIRTQKGMGYVIE